VPQSMAASVISCWPIFVFMHNSEKTFIVSLKSWSEALM
jgi:hypothetical protein